MTQVDLPTPAVRSKTFSASNAARFMACPASANLELAILGYVPPVVDEEKGMKGEGSEMHDYLDRVSKFPARKLRAIALILNYMADLRDRRRFKMLTEQTIVAEWLDTKPKTTVDVVLYTADELHVIDYKWGAIPVPVVDNAQLMFYAASFIHLSPKAKGVSLHILQPMADNMDEVFIPVKELADFMDEARAAEKKVIAKDVTFGPSDHCKFCPANPHSRGDKGKPLCPAMMQLLYPSKVDEAAILDL